MAPPAPDHPALGLLTDLEEQELALVQFFFPQASNTMPRRRLDWDAVPREIYISAWRSLADQHAGLLQGLTVDQVPSLLNNPNALVRLVPNPPGQLLTREMRAGVAREVIIAAALVRLLDAGWTCVIRPGVKHFAKGSQTSQPWVGLRARPVDEAPWLDLAAQAGLSQMPLYGGAPPAA